MIQQLNRERAIGVCGGSVALLSLARDADRGELWVALFGDGEAAVNVMFDHVGYD